MRILFVTWVNCVHTARWIAQLDGLGWDLHIFAVSQSTPHPELRGVTVHRLITGPRTRSVLPQIGFSWPFARGETRAMQLLEKFDRYSAAARLARLVQSLKPDIVHSLAMHGGAYDVLNARKRIGVQFPPWIYSCWGVDIHHFGRLPEHEERIRQVLRYSDYMTTDCRRDVQLAREFGFSGETVGVFPGGGGFDLQEMRAVRQPGPVRSRRVIVVKGYQCHPGSVRNDHPGARGLVAIEALRRCAPLLPGYEVVVYSAYPEVRVAGEQLAREAKLPFRFPPLLTHREMARLFGSARIAIGLATSDGTPNAMLEAMIAGAFPIQSDTISTREWIDGENGLLVPPEDATAVAEAITRAVKDDNMVDRAAELNATMADQRLERGAIQAKVIEMYQLVKAHGGERIRRRAECLV